MKMNAGLMALMVFALCSTGAFASGKLPSTIQCTNVECLDGYKDFCAVGVEGPVKISDADYERDGMLIIDYSEGDQYHTYTFKVSDLEALQASKGQQQKMVIGGTYEDGFDWANGYNVRALVRMECTL